MAESAISFRWSGMAEFDRALDDMVARVDEAGRLALARAAHEVERAAKDHASGRPGPNVVTGTLRRSIVVAGITRQGARGWGTFVGPTTVYGRRVELGFEGPDRRGRVYHQSGHPFLEPGFREVEGRLQDLFARTWDEAIAA